MQLLPMGSSDMCVRWRAVPNPGEAISPVEIRKIFVRHCADRSIEIQDLLNGSYVLAFPDGIDATQRSRLYEAILASGYVAA